LERRYGPGSRLFCTAAPDLKTAALLIPGSFGVRILGCPVVRGREADPANCLVAFQELVLELVRAKEFPGRPSRLESLFLWEQEERARSFHSRRPWQTGLYEVELVEVSRQFIAEMDLVSYWRDGETTATWMERAREYWTNTSARAPEVLVDGTARILRRLV
jgi:hypothetical protein